MTLHTLCRGERIALESDVVTCELTPTVPFVRSEADYDAAIAAPEFDIECSFCTLPMRAKWSPGRLTVQPCGCRGEVADRARWRSHQAES